MKKYLFALLIACALVVSAAAHGKQHDHKQSEKSAAQTGAAQAAFLGKGDGVDTCPVTGEPITNKDVKADFFGRTVYFCCPGCLEEAKKKPEAYVKKTHAEQLAAIKNTKPADHHAEHADHAMAKDQDKAKDGEVKFLGKGDGIETCPVTGEPVNKNLKSEVNGITFYVCCEGCIETVKKNPAAYLKKAEKK